MLNFSPLRVEIEIGDVRQRADVPWSLGPGAPGCSGPQSLGVRSLCFLPLCYQGAWAEDTLDKSPCSSSSVGSQHSPALPSHRLAGRIEMVCTKVVYNQCKALFLPVEMETCRVEM